MFIIKRKIILIFSSIEGKNIAEETIKQHLADNDGAYPETIACTLWGLDTIKTRGKLRSLSYRYFSHRNQTRSKLGVILKIKANLLQLYSH
jgi:hypothetical protein